MKGERESLARKLRVTTEQMAHRCSVDQVLWNMHSNACLEAADTIERLLSSSKAEGEMREALEKRAAACPECKGVGKILVSFVSQYDGHVTDTRTACPSCRDLRAALSPKEGG